MHNEQTQISNEFALQQPVLLQLSPFGEFPHSKGIQLMDDTAAQTILKNFNSFFARLGRRFAGLPIYVGHPDLPGAENIYNDHKAYGWIMQLHLKPDGLYGEPKWSKVGRELLENAHYKFLSPFWEAAEVGARNGRKLYRPHTLISVGLTNQPNLPMFPLSNEKGSGTPKRRRFFGLPLEVPHPSEHGDPSPHQPPLCDNHVAQASLPASEGGILPPQERGEPSPQAPAPGKVPLCDLPSAPLFAPANVNTGHQIRGGLGKPISAHPSASPSTPTALRPSAQGCDEVATLGNPHFPNQPQRGCGNPSPAAAHASVSHFMNNTEQIQNNQTDTETETTHPDVGLLLAQLQQTLHHMGQRVDELNSRFLSVMVDNAILDGRISPADRERWRAELDHDFPVKSLQLVNTLRTMKVDTRTEDFAPVAPSGEASHARDQRIQKVLREKMANGLTYDQAWQEFKLENPAVLAAMGQPFNPRQRDNANSA